MNISIPAFKGRGNFEELTFFEPDGSTVDWTAAGILSAIDGAKVHITTARFFAGGAFVEAILLSAGRIRFQPGLLQISPRQYPAQLVVYSEDDSAGTTIAGPNLPVSLLLDMAP